jgi:hypothetical protein
MGEILQFPGGARYIPKHLTGRHPTSVVPPKPKENWYFNYESRAILESKILDILSHKRLMFISTILKKVDHPESCQVFVTLGNMERLGKIEQLEVQGENKRIKGYFRLKE